MKTESPRGGMDCEAFDNALVDALYEELDEVRMRGLERHAEGCASCAEKLAGFRATRDRVPQSILLETPSENLESRILAAVEIALAKNNPQPMVAQAPATGGARVYAFLARPQFAIAAAFVLVLGASVVFLSNATKSEPATAAAPAEQRAAGKAKLGEGQASPSPPSVVATPTAAASMAYNDDPAPPPAAAPHQAAKPSDLGGATKGGIDGRCAVVEERAKTAAAAELELARCIAQTQGCKAAAPHFDKAAHRNAGTETGSRATLEAARCYAELGDATNARSRYSALQKDRYVASEANESLSELNRSKKAAPPATATARPQTTTSATNVLH